MHAIQSKLGPVESTITDGSMAQIEVPCPAQFIDNLPQISTSDEANCVENNSNVKPPAETRIFEKSDDRMETTMQSSVQIDCHLN